MTNDVTSGGEASADEIVQGDAREEISKLPADSVDSVITSPPYWTLRDYDHDDQLGMEESPAAYVDEIVAIVEECRRVLKPTGNLVINLGDTYNTNSIVRADASGLQMQQGDEGYEEYHTKEGRERAGRRRRSPVEDVPKRSRLLIPSRIAIALTDLGWCCHNRIPWVKPSGGQDSATDRFRNRHEQWFYFSLDAADHYFGDRSEYDVLEQMSARDGSHNAQYPVELVEPLIRQTCPKDGLVLDPFVGSGTTAVAAARLDREYIGIELRPDYAQEARDRLENTTTAGLGQWVNV